jgi:predicted DNA-binding transcriptional regulator YafY
MRADRLFAIMMLLQAHRKMTTRNLAETLGVSKRTILRDIDALSIAGIPLYTEGGRSGGVGLDENYQLALTGLKANEVRTLFVSGVPNLLNDVGLDGKAENTLLQLFAALPSPHQQAAEQIRQRLHIDPLWWGQEETIPPFWHDLQKAVFDDLSLAVTYEYPSGETVERIIEPYSLVMKAGVWYLVARREGEFRTYRVSRFQTITLKSTCFQRQAGFDLATHWQQHLQDMKASASKYTFKLHLTPPGLHYLKAISPTSAEIIELPTENGDLMAQVTVSSLDYAKIVVFGLGTEASIIEPSELQEAVLTTAREILAKAVVEQGVQ